jgi:hypothetical protein
MELHIKLHIISVLKDYRTTHQSLLRHIQVKYSDTSFILPPFFSDSHALRGMKVEQ